MGKGYILVRLFEVKNALPKTSGNLKITNAETGETVYEKNNAFDKSGLSERIEVEAPDKRLSQEPYEEGVMPYGLYNIHVDADDNEEVDIEGVSVFEDNTSIQNIELRDEEDLSGISNTSEEIEIPPHHLLDDTEEGEQVGTLKPFVLDEPYIPEFIVVHLGPPNVPAENVTIGFIDYIKNVASSEIYPTWPLESLKANIYCQISFALNRVYTEWYRNKGFPFQITNSTAYDQAFVKGRNIFENISKIVDEVFSKYIAIIGNRTPYFAQYCDGIRVKCKGLSQWGTVDLANAGMEALSIIRYYFGYDKELIRADMIEGIPESYPGKPLRLNDDNENVMVIQKQLNRISQNFPAIPKIINPNGFFGKDTQESVKTFQKIFNLIQDGIVGRATWYSISNIYVAVTRLAELDPDYPNDDNGNGKPPNDPYPGYILRYGSTGDDVRRMQTYLAAISKYYNIPTIKPDGIFGNLTKDTVIAFQRLFGLVPDGLVGQITWNKIYEVYLGLEDKNKKPEPEFDGKYPGYLLSYGSTGEKVREMQTYLALISTAYNIPKIVPDGIFGELTRRAVLEFQRLFSLAQDGIVGRQTWDKIYEVYSNLIETKVKPSSIYSKDYPGYVLKEYVISDDVKWLQTYLQAIANFYKQIPFVEVNGIFNKKTKNAVMAFQKTFGLEQNGMIGVNDWTKLIEVYNSLQAGKDINKSPILYDFPGFDLQVGQDNGYVSVLQQYINVIAKNDRKINEVRVTGIFDNRTKRAVERLQSKFGIDPTGIVNEITWNKIKSLYEELYTGIKVNYNSKMKRRKTR